MLALNIAYSGSKWLYVISHEQAHEDNQTESVNFKLKSDLDAFGVSTSTDILLNFFSKCN